MTKYRRGQLALKILYFVSVGAAIPAVLVAPNMAKVLFPLLRGFAKRLESRSYALKKSLVKLKEDRFLRIEKRGDDYVLVLTEKGRTRVLRGKIETLRIPRPKHWDKKWRVILFDIPEQHKKAREALRQKLRELGFYHLQKSCFVYPFECRDEVDFISEFFGVFDHINYVVAESLGGEEELKKFFSLN